MIKAKQINKFFKQKKAVSNVDFDVPRGQIFGLLGPNAAGKTTTLRLLCGILQADSGTVRIADHPVAEAKRDFGYVAQYFSQYEELTVWENVSFYAKMYGVEDDKWLNSLLERYALAQFKHQFARALSGGYQRRLALVCALAHDPKVLFLDEPTAGIDPVTRKLLWDDFYKLSHAGKTLFITTHYMEEAQRCHELAFISSGNIVAKGNPDNIIEAMGDVVVYSCQLAYLPELQEQLQASTGVILLNQFGIELRIVVEKNVDPQHLETLIQQHSDQPVRLSKIKANLEDAFMMLTQHNEVSS